MSKESRGADVGRIGLGICVLDISFKWFDKFVPFLADVASRYEIVFIRVYRHYVHAARGMIVKKALSDRCSHLFFLDDDTIPPLGAIDMLLADDKPVVGGWVRQRQGSYYPMIMREEKEDNSGLVGIIDPPSDVQNLIACHGIHMACTLIKREVLEAIAEKNKEEPNPWFGSQASTFGEDVIFCRRAREAGFGVWCDPTVKCDHIGDSIIINDDTVGFVKEYDKVLEA